MVSVVQIIFALVALHVLALGCAGALVWYAIRSQTPDAWQAGDGGSDDGGNDRRRPPSPPRLPGGGLPIQTGKIPLLDAVPARVRLRDGRKLADLLPPRERRPAREPQRTPVRQ